MAPAAVRGVLEALKALARCRQAVADAAAGIPQQRLSPWITAGTPRMRSSGAWPAVLPSAQHGWLVQGHAAGASALCRQEHWRPLAVQQPSLAGHAGIVTKTRKSSPLSDRYKTRPTNYVQLLQHVHRARNLVQLEDLLANFGDKFDAVHVAAAMTVLPKCLRHKLGHGEALPPELGAQAAVLLAKLQDMAQEHKGRLYVRQIANMVWALGQCRKLPAVSTPYPAAKGPRSKAARQPRGTAGAAAELLEDLLDELAAKGFRGFGGRDVTQLLHGMARLRLRHTPALNRLARFTITHAHTFEAKHLALTAWGFARLRYNSKPLYGAIADAAVAQHTYLRPWSGSALLGAFARRGVRHPGVCAAACEALSVQVRSFGPREMGVVAWALGRLRHRDEALLQALAAHATQVLDSFGPLELGLLMKGLHDAKVVSKPLMDAVATGIASETAVVLAPADGVRMVAAFAALDPHNVSAMAMGDRIAAACARRVRVMSGRQAAECVMALSRLGVRHDGLLLALGLHVAKMLAPLTEQEEKKKQGEAGADPRSTVSCSDADLANILVGYSRFGCLHEELGKAALKRLSQMVEGLSEAAEAAGGQLGSAAAVELEHAIDIASELAVADQLSKEAGSSLAAVIGAHLHTLRPRKLAMALRALSSHDVLLQQAPVRELFAASAAHLSTLQDDKEQTDQQPQKQQASPLVLSACTLALARAGQGRHVEVDGVLSGLFELAAEQLDDFSEPQACELFTAVQLSGGMGRTGELDTALSLLGQRRGWEGLERMAASA